MGKRSDQKKNPAAGGGTGGTGIQHCRSTSYLDLHTLD